MYSTGAHLGYCSKLPKQTVWLEDYKILPLRVILHELFHVLGRYHEHSRIDRNRYVKVYLENIEKGDFWMCLYNIGTCVYSKDCFLFVSLSFFPPPSHKNTFYSSFFLSTAISDKQMFFSSFFFFLCLSILF